MGERETGDLDRLIKELSILRRGRGLRRSTLGPVVGPTLRRCLELPADADESRTRLAVADGLVAAVRTLPQDLKLAFLFAMAVRSDRHTLTERLEQVVPRIDRDLRTVHRRVATATEAAAAHLLDGQARRVNHPLAPAGWTILTFRSVIDLSAPRPCVTGERTILAGEPLTSIAEAVSLPPQSPDDVTVEVLEGGTLRSREQVSGSASVWRWEIDLGRTVPSGGSHALTVRVSVADPDGSHRSTR